MPKVGSATARGYGQQHQRERRRWAPKVAAGLVDCHAPTCVMPTRLIRASDEWDLGHTKDRTAWRGPEHSACNRAEGARISNANRRPASRTSRGW